MRRGTDMTVRGTSSKNTYSLDTYSLLGFTAAYDAMVEACAARDLVTRDDRPRAPAAARRGGARAEPDRPQPRRARSAAGRARRARAAGGAARAPALALAVPAGRPRLRGDDHAAGGAARAGSQQPCDIARPEVVGEQVSSDGTRKWLLRFADRQEVESVFIPEEERGALCLSTQVGCSLTCAFCHTGTMPLARNLGADEIVGQLLVARDALGEWPTPAGARRLSHLVVMGMGEPLLNYEQTARALQLAMDPDGLAFARRRITLSTSGVVPKIETLRARARRRARDLAARGAGRAARPAGAD